MSVEYGVLTFDRLGHASVRIETADGRVAYIDPWSEVLKESPGDADVVFVTHDDFDHYDPDGLDAVSNDDTVVVVYEGVDSNDGDLDPGRRTFGSVSTLAWNGELEVAGIGVRAVPAYNRHDGDHVDSSGDPFHAEGEVVGLHLSFDGTIVYVPSDTDFLDEHEGLTADVFVPPIGGHYTMDRHEAADFAESVGSDLVLPVHYDTFGAIETDAEAFERDVESRGSRVERF